MLISLLSVSLIVFSQKDTAINSKCFPIPVVKQIMKDVLGGDSARAQLDLTSQQLLQTERKSILKDSVINSLRQKETNYLELIKSEKEKFEIVKEYANKKEIELSKEKKKNKRNSVIFGGIIALMTYLLIK